MKVLIFGKTGQLGAELHDQLGKKHEIIAPSSRQLPIENSKRVSNFIAREKPDLVINATAYHVVPECEDHPDLALLINAIAVKNMAVACQEIGARFVHFSTDYVFDGVGKKTYKEEDVPNPLQMYGISKLAGEFLALNYNSQSIVIRTAYLYGGKAGSRSKKGNFVLTILSQAKDKDKLEVAADQIVSPTYASHLATGAIKLITGKVPAGIYHLAGEGSCTLSDFAKEILKLANSGTKIVPVVRGQGVPKRPMHSPLKNIAAKKYGVTMPSWKVGLAQYLNFLNS